MIMFHVTFRADILKTFLTKKALGKCECNIFCKLHTDPNHLPIAFKSSKIEGFENLFINNIAEGY